MDEMVTGEMSATQTVNSTDEAIGESREPPLSCGSVLKPDGVDYKIAATLSYIAVCSPL